MLREIFSFLGKLYQLVISLFVIALLAGFGWVLWQAYEDEVLQNRFLTEGREVQVRVEEVDVHQRSWRDMLGNSAYITFPYHQKTYTTRITRDSAWVSSGDRIRLLYHPDLDSFRQIQVDRKPNRTVSRLVNWSAVQGFSKEHKLLLGFLVVATAVFFLAGGFIVQLTGWTFIQTVARLVLVVILGIAALFFTYDVIEYVQYYKRLRSSSQPMQVTVLETDRHLIGKGSDHGTGFRMYDYDATFRYRNQERVIVIQKSDYERLQPNDPFTVVYSASLDDFMPQGYPGDYFRILVPLSIWLVFLVVLWNILAKKKPAPSGLG